MGNARFTSSAWASTVNTRSAAMNAADVYTRHTAREDFKPVNIKIRESRDSDANPNSTPIMLWLDGTGSMGDVALQIAKTELGKVFLEIYDRKPVTDPHILAGVLGDVRYDQYPVQATQFEGDIKVSDQMADLVIELGGGGNRTESYEAPWYFAATKTVTDAWEKRRKKGFLFTMGDEEAPTGLTSEQVLRFFGDHIQKDLSAEELLKMAREKWEVYHLMIAQGSHARAAERQVRESWSALLGQNAIWVPDYSKIGEIIVSAIQIANGADIDKVVSSWSGDTSMVVGAALNALAKSGTHSEEGLAAL